MKIFYIIIFILSIGKVCSKSLPVYNTLNNSSVNLFEDINPKIRPIYVDIIKGHDSTRIEEYRNNFIIKSKKFINDTINSVDKSIKYNVDSGYIYDFINNPDFYKNTLKWNIHPIITNPNSGDSLTLLKSLYTPCWSLNDYNKSINVSRHDSIIKDQIFEIYETIIISISKRDTIFEIEDFEKMRFKIEKLIAKVDEPVYRSLLEFQFYLFVYTNSRHSHLLSQKISQEWFMGEYMKQFEGRIFSFSRLMKANCYYHIARMLNEREMNNYAYKYYYKSYYASISGNDKKLYPFSNNSYYQLHSILEKQNNNYFFRVKKIDLTNSLESIYVTEQDSFNLVLLKYVSVLNHFFTDSVILINDRSKEKIEVYSMYEMIRTIEDAKKRKLTIDYYIFSKCAQYLGFYLWKWSNSVNSYITYTALAANISIQSDENSAQFMNYLYSQTGILLANNYLSQARYNTQKMYDYSNIFPLIKYRALTLDRQILYHCVTKHTDSIIYYKKLYDSLYYSYTLNTNIIYNSYLPSLERIRDYLKDNSINEQIENIKSKKQDDYTLEYSFITKMEQEAKDEINEAENRKLLLDAKKSERTVILIGSFFLLAVIIFIVTMVKNKQVNVKKKEAALYKSNFFKDIINFHPQKSGLPTIIAKLNLLAVDISIPIPISELEKNISQTIKITSTYRKYIEQLLSNSKKDRICLIDEINNCEQFITFMNLSNNKQVVFDKTQIAGFESLEIPPNIIIPFIENSFQHAFKDDLSEKIISVEIEKQDNLSIVCKDNGIGINKKSNNPGSGVSLDSVKEYLNNYNILNSTKYYFDPDDRLNCRNNILKNDKIVGSFARIKNLKYD